MQKDIANGCCVSNLAVPLQSPFLMNKEPETQNKRGIIRKKGVERVSGLKIKSVLSLKGRYTFLLLSY